MSGTVTVTQGGSTDVGTNAFLVVLTGQPPNPVGKTDGATSATPSFAFTPNATGSYVYGSSLALAGTDTPNAATVFKRNGTGQGLQYVSLRSSAPTTAATPVTLGGTGVTGVSIALAEFLADTEDASSPGGFNSSTPSVTSPAFTPPAGSVMALMIQTNGGAGIVTMGVTDTLGLGITWTEVSVPVGGNLAGNGYAGVWAGKFPGATSPRGLLIASGIV